MCIIGCWLSLLLDGDLLLNNRLHSVQVLALEYRADEDLDLEVEQSQKVSSLDLELQENESKVRILSGSPSERRTVLDSLLGTILSQNTTDKNSRRAFASLKTAFPTWEQVSCKFNLLSFRSHGLKIKIRLLGAR